MNLSYGTYKLTYNVMGYYKWHSRLTFYPYIDVSSYKIQISNTHHQNKMMFYENLYRYFWCKHNFKVNFELLETKHEHHISLVLSPFGYTVSMRNSSNSSEPGARNTNLDSEWSQPNNFLYYPTELVSNYNAKVRVKCMSLNPKRMQNVLITKYISD